MSNLSEYHIKLNGIKISKGKTELIPNDAVNVLAIDQLNLIVFVLRLSKTEKLKNIIPEGSNKKRKSDNFESQTLLQCADKLESESQISSDCSELSHNDYSNNIQEECSNSDIQNHGTSNVDEDDNIDNVDNEVLNSSSDQDQINDNPDGKLYSPIKTRGQRKKKL